MRLPSGFLAPTCTPFRPAPVANIYNPCSKLQVVKIAAIHNVDIRLCSHCKFELHYEYGYGTGGRVCGRATPMLSSRLQAKIPLGILHGKYVNNIFMQENRREMYKYTALEFYASRSHSWWVAEHMNMIHIQHTLPVPRPAHISSANHPKDHLFCSLNCIFFA